MAEVIGTIRNIKLNRFLPDTVNAFDIGTLTVKETSTGTQWLFYLWITRADAPAVERVIGTQRLALAREAAFRKLTVHIVHENDSSIVTSIQMDLP